MSLESLRYSVPGILESRSSGSAALDDATCAVMYLRARHRPARNAEGNPTIDVDSSSVRWQLP